MRVEKFYPPILLYMCVYIFGAEYNENNSPCDALSADYFIP